MKRVNGKISIIAVTLVIITAIVFYYEEIKTANAEIPTVPVVIASENISENTVITEDMVTTTERYTEDAVEQKGNLTSHPSKVIGKRTKAPLYKNEPINVNRLVENEAYMEKDKEQFAFAIEGASQALNIEPGSYVDIWSEPLEEGLGEPEKLFSKLKVREVKNKDFVRLEDVENPKEAVPSFVIIDLTGQKIETLLNKRQTSSLQLSLHGQTQIYDIVNGEQEEAENENSGDKQDEENGEAGEEKEENADG